MAVTYNLVNSAQTRLSSEEQEIAKFMKPTHQKEFAKLSKYKRERLVTNIYRDLKRKGIDMSALEDESGSYLGYSMNKNLLKGSTKPARMLLGHYRKKRSRNYYIKRNAQITNLDGTINKKLIREIANPTEKGRQKAIEKMVKSDKARQKQEKKDFKKFEKNYDKANGKVLKKDNRVAKRKNAYAKIGAKLDEHFKSGKGKTSQQLSGEDFKRKWEAKAMEKLKNKLGNKATKLGGKILLKMMALLFKLFAALLAPLLPVLLVLLVVVLVVAVICAIFAFLGQEEEEKLRAQNTAVFGTYAISPDVLRYREQILREAKKYGYDEYIDLYLAVCQQESGGHGNDIFQASESKGKSAGTLSVDASIKQGVKVLTNNLKRAKVRKVDDIARIKIALQAYNMGGGYIDYIKSGGYVEHINYDMRGVSASKPEGKLKWTQENVLAYQKKKANGKKRTKNADTLGPYAYGDAYYTEHVLRYYVYADGMAGKLSVKAGVAAKVPQTKRQNFIFGGRIPQSSSEMQSYLVSVNVPIINEKGKKTTMVLTCHKKLANEFLAVFKDMKKAKFPIKASSTKCYVWKTIIGTNSVSQHSYGLAIDVNWNDNPCFYSNVNVSNGYKGYQPGKNKFSVTKKIIAIWKAHGFYWGGDWNNKKDTMHFSYTEA